MLITKKKRKHRIKQILSDEIQKDEKKIIELSGNIKRVARECERFTHEKTCSEVDYDFLVNQFKTKYFELGSNMVNWNMMMNLIK